GCPGAGAQRLRAALLRPEARPGPPRRRLRHGQVDHALADRDERHLCRDHQAGQRPARQDPSGTGHRGGRASADGRPGERYTGQELTVGVGRFSRLVERGGARMLVQERPRLTAFGHDVDTQPEHFGALRDSSAIRDDGDALRARMAEDGYLYLPGYFDTAAVLAARRGLTDRLAEDDLLEPGTPILDAVARQGPPTGKPATRTDLLAKQVA